MGEARRGRGGKEKEVREVSRSGRERGGVREGEGSLAGSRKVSGRGDGGGGVKGGTKSLSQTSIHSRATEHLERSTNDEVSIL